ncbi:thioester dehydrase [Parashewanella curva]|uniref:Thioester dehydrase n=1 Tax=Parashewanella curva TaxID=2338552 RepID=A0A3L8PZ05_9GAMM|nr:thioester dehydrase [Parashewanella curva]RLV60525.1 thioester dehydrase [Parashewanella curva]
MIKSQLPKILEQHISDTEGFWRLFVDASLPFFNGHFPQQAVLPGVTQLDWVIKIGCGTFGYPTNVAQLEVLKFQQLILPNTEVELRITHKLEQKKLLFSVTQGEKQFASGRISIKTE